MVGKLLCKLKLHAWQPTWTLPCHKCKRCGIDDGYRGSPINN